MGVRSLSTAVRIRAGLAALAVLTASLAAGCVAHRDPVAPAAPPGGVPTTSGHYPLTVENCGEKVTFSKAPRRAVAAYEPSLKILLDLGLADRIIGRTAFNEGEPALPADQVKAKEAIPVISKDISLPPKEAMVNLAADFVWAVQEGEFDVATGKASRAQLASLGAGTFLSTAWCDQDGAGALTLEQTFDDVLTIGRIFDIEDRAQELVARQRAAVDRAAAKVKNAEPVRVLAYNEGTGPLSLVGSGLNDLFALAGAQNVFRNEEGYAKISIEAAAAANPDVFVIFDYPSFDGKSGTTAEEKAETLFRLLPTTTAAKNRAWVKMYAVDQHPGGFNADFVVRLAQALHPEAFGS